MEGFLAQVALAGIEDSWIDGTPLVFVHVSFVSTSYYPKHGELLTYLPSPCIGCVYLYNMG